MKRKRPPLKGKLIVVTRSASGSAEWQKHFADLGAKTYAFPTIQTLPQAPDARTLRIMKRICDFDRVVVTSAEGVNAMTALIGRPDIKIPPSRVRALAVLGSGTEKIARTAGYRNIFRPSSADAMALGWELKFERGARLLFLRSTIASHALPNILAARGARVTDVPVYRTVPVRGPDERFSKLLKDGAVDFLVFASPSAVRGFFVRVKDKTLQKEAREVPAVAIGPRVAGTLEKHGFKDVRTAAEPTMKEMANAMI